MNPKEQLIREDHIKLLLDSAIAEDVAKDCCKTIQSVDDVPDDFKDQMSYISKNLPALLFSLPTLTGDTVNIIRPNDPKVGKYLLPTGKSGIYYNKKKGKNTKVVFVEGIKQYLAAVSCADAETLVLGLNGCYGWSKEGLARPEINSIPHLTTNIEFFLCFDADVASNFNVWEACSKLHKHLSNVYGVDPRLIDIPASGTEGLDDYLASIPIENRREVFSNMLKSASKKLPRKPKKSKKDETVSTDEIEVVKKPEGEIPEQFYSPQLMELIHDEIDRYHKRDYKEKIALFIIRASAELRSDRDRCSVALKGESSSGKDNIIKAVFDLFPEDDSFILTRGTQSALEEKSSEVKAIAFSEINANRENGANSELTEFFKQLSEGGCRVIKRDKSTNQILDIKSEQKSLFYGTTETETDEELQTRYIVIPIRSSRDKNRIVINDVLTSLSSPENLMNKITVAKWISHGITLLEHDVEVVIPFNKYLKEKIKDTDGKEKYFFDESKDRVKRDIKRIMSLTKAVAWLHQKQRRMVEIEGFKFLYAEPSDFYTVIEIFADFFNLTYTGLDHRLQMCYDKIKELEGKHQDDIISDGYDTKYQNWVLRHKLQEELGIQSMNTIKKRIESLKDYQMIDTHYDHSVSNKAYLVKQSGYQSGINRLSLPVSLTGIDTHLTGKMTPEKIKKIYDKNSFTPISLEFLRLKASTPIDSASEEYFSGKLTPVKLTPVNSEIETPSLTEFFEGKSEASKQSLVDLYGSADAVDLASKQGLIVQIRPDIYQIAK